MWIKDHTGTQMTSSAGKAIVFPVGDRYRASIHPADEAGWHVIGYADTMEDGQAMCERALGNIQERLNAKEFSYLATGAFITILVVGLLMLHNWGVM